MIENVPIPSWLKRFLPGGETSRWQRLVAYGYRLGVSGAKELRHDKAGQMAAALTFHTLFSLLPMLIVGMVVVNSLASEEDRDRLIVKMVDTAIPMAETAPVAGEAPEITARRAELLETRRTIGNRLLELMTKAKEYVHFSGVGVVGVLVFVYGATALLATIERSFNAIFGVPHQRPWYLRIPMYYTVITLGPLLLIAGQAIQAKMMSLISGERLTAWLAGPVAVVSPVITTWALLFALYALLPNTKVNKRSAAIGALVAAIGWVVMQELFALYVKNAGATTFYGALALLPLFLMWLYYTWLIVLFGGELTHIVSAMEAGNFKHAQNKTDDKLVDASWMVPLATTIAEAFAKGRAVDATKLARDLNLPARAVGEMLTALERACIVHRVEQSAGVGYALARPADHIGLHEIVEVGRQMLPQEPTENASPAWQFVHRAHTSALAGQPNLTLADMCRENCR